MKIVYHETMIPIDIQVRKIYHSVKLKCRDRDSNPGPVAPQAQSLTTPPPPLPSISAVDIYLLHVIKLFFT